MALLSRKSRGLRLTARGVGRLATLAVAQVARSETVPGRRSRPALI